ncbi:MAG: hypothetical protein QNK38_03965, partial [Nitrospirota bacterium]|nr:hypothetical protein [Nitrospirota bacterium]MDX2420219.1 hypothetical protein [Nitrospirota bacterium]
VVSRGYDFTIKKITGKMRNAWLTETHLSRHIGGNSLQNVSHCMQRDHEAFSQQSWFFLNEGETTRVGQRSL